MAAPRGPLAHCSFPSRPAIPETMPENQNLYPCDPRLMYMCAPDLSAQEELKDRIPLRRFGHVDEVADAAAFLAKNPYASNCILNLDGGLSAT